MTIGLIMVTAPALEPVSLEEAKLHLRVDDDSPSTNLDDSLIEAVIKASRQWAEQFQNRAYITQTWNLYLDSFPREKYIEIPKPPLQYVVSMTYKDGSGASQAVSFLDPSGTALLETDDYLIDIAREPGRLYLKSGKAWPASLNEAQAVTIQFVAGYGDAADVPAMVKQSILLKVSSLYENRGDADAPEGYERAAKCMLWPERVVPI